MAFTDSAAHTAVVLKLGVASTLHCAPHCVGTTCRIYTLMTTTARDCHDWPAAAIRRHTLRLYPSASIQAIHPRLESEACNARGWRQIHKPHVNQVPPAPGGRDPGDWSAKTQCADSRAESGAALFGITPPPRAPQRGPAGARTAASARPRVGRAAPAAPPPPHRRAHRRPQTTAPPSRVVRS